eukprot:m.184855 g.184855  ORF g.184855 m.184855 type:complete len:767 (+) comp16246_c0_seq1:39-2339(+)
MRLCVAGVLAGTIVAVGGQSTTLIKVNFTQQGNDLTNPWNFFNCQYGDAATDFIECQVPTSDTVNETNGWTPIPINRPLTITGNPMLGLFNGLSRSTASRNRTVVSNAINVSAYERVTLTVEIGATYRDEPREFRGPFVVQPFVAGLDGDVAVTPVTRTIEVPGWQDVRPMYNLSFDINTTDVTRITVAFNRTVADTIVRINVIDVTATFCSPNLTAPSGRFVATCPPPPPTAGAAGSEDNSAGVAAGAVVAVLIVLAALGAVVWYRRKYHAATGTVNYDGFSGMGPSLGGSVVRGEKADRDCDTYQDPSEYANSEALAEHIRQWSTELSRSSIHMTERLGAGEFGEVFGGRVKIDEELIDCAFKTLRPKASLSEKREFLAEAGIMAQFKHKNVVSLHGVVLEGEPIIIVLELMTKGALIDYLKEHAGNIDLLQKILFARDVADGMAYLASKAFVHRDLAARNILLNEQLDAKVADFGLSKSLDDESEYFKSEGGKIPIRWTAPEAMANKKYTTTSDVWSFGILLWEIMSEGARPYDGMDNLKVVTEVDRGYRMPAPPNCPKALHGLMLRCWEADRRSRILFPEIADELKGRHTELTANGYLYVEGEDETTPPEPEAEDYGVPQDSRPPSLAVAPNNFTSASTAGVGNGGDGGDDGIVAPGTPVVSTTALQPPTVAVRAQPTVSTRVPYDYTQPDGIGATDYAEPQDGVMLDTYGLPQESSTDDPVDPDGAGSAPAAAPREPPKPAARRPTAERPAPRPRPTKGSL